MTLSAITTSFDAAPILRGALRRALGAAALVGMAIIHLVDIPGKFGETPYIGVLFLLLIGASLGAAEMLIRGSSVLAWGAGAVLAASTLVAYTISRTAGLPGAPTDDIGNWSEPLGLSSLLVEALVLWLCVTGFLEARPHRVSV